MFVDLGLSEPIRSSLMSIHKFQTEAAMDAFRGILTDAKQLQRDNVFVCFSKRPSLDSP